MELRAFCLLHISCQLFCILWLLRSFAAWLGKRTPAGVLPGFLADKDPLLQRVLPEQAQFTRTFWMSMPPELRQVPGIQVVWRFLQATVQEQQAVLMC